MSDSYFPVSRKGKDLISEATAYDAYKFLTNFIPQNDTEASLVCLVDHCVEAIRVMRQDSMASGNIRKTARTTSV